jgi:hypothetical protein
MRKALRAKRQHLRQVSDHSGPIVVSSPHAREAEFVAGAGGLA